MRLFGTSGIRGIANVELTPQFAAEVGAALGTQVNEGTVLVGRDPRLSGELLGDALSAGLLSTGVDVMDAGITPTPALAFLTRELDAEAGVSVTASHNPPEYNGFKIFDRDGMAFGSELERRLQSILSARSYRHSKATAIGRRSKVDGTSLYRSALISRLGLHRAWRVAVDLFNGATCSLLPNLFSSLGLDVCVVNGQIDSAYRLGRPEPTEASLVTLARIVSDLEADIGFGYDGDGDRVVAVDESGHVPLPDRVLAAYASYMVEKNRGGTVVTHVEASRCVEDAVGSHGGKVVRTRVGDVSIAEAVRQCGAVFGGEPIGAWIHPDFHYCPDGVLSSLLLLKALENEQKTLGEFVKDVKVYHMSRENIPCPNERKAAVMDAVQEQIVTVFPDIFSTTSIDGFRADFEQGWVLIRPSGTEPLVRVTAESTSRSTTQKMSRTAKSIIQERIEAV